MAAIDLRIGVIVMASDRVYIKCKYCEGWKMLLKFSPSSGSTSRANEVLNWLDKHADCHPRRYEINLNGDPGFTLHTEEGHVDEKELKWGKQNFDP